MFCHFLTRRRARWWPTACASWPTHEHAIRPSTYALATPKPPFLCHGPRSRARWWPTSCASWLMPKHAIRPSFHVATTPRKAFSLRFSSSYPAQARKVVANIMRLVADAMAPGTLAAQPQIRARLLDWMRDTTQYLRSLAPFGEAFWEVSQVRCFACTSGLGCLIFWSYCFCCTCAA